MMFLLQWLLLLLPQSWAGQVELRVDGGGDIYAGMPFVLEVVARDFEEDPEPVVEGFNIEGCSVSYLGMSPMVSSRTTIINGRISESRDVTFVYRYELKPKQAGRYNVPAITVTQGSDVGRSRPSRFDASAIRTTKDLMIELEWPEHSPRVGETLPVYLNVLTQVPPTSLRIQDIQIPVFADTDLLHIVAPPAEGRSVLGLEAGSGRWDFPYSIQEVTVDRRPFYRLRVESQVTFQKAGTLSAEGASITAKMPTGRVGRGVFAETRYEMFQAYDDDIRVQIRPLPLQGRPKTFAGAVGEAFNIEVTAETTVIQVGEPVPVELVIRGKGQLEGLQLPDLIQAGLSPDSFKVLDEQPVGELTEDGGKRFTVPIQVLSVQVRELPALEFSYFDPSEERYVRARSKPIALAVEGSEVVSADEIESASPLGTRSSDASTPRQSRTLSAEDLSLSEPETTLASPLLSPQFGGLRGLLMALYGLPLVLGAGVLLRRRTAETRTVKAEQRTIKKQLVEALKAARKQPTRESYGPLCEAIKRFAKQDGADVKSLIASIEEEAFSPQAADSPLSMANIERVQALLGGKGPTTQSLAVWWLCLALGGGIGTAEANVDVEQARQLYTSALEIDDRTKRIEAFGLAADAYGQLAAVHPNAPELHTDWGNAAAKSEQLGVAALAYQRALRINPGHQRAAQNLSLLQDNLPDWVREEESNASVQDLLIWSSFLNSAEIAVAGGVLFSVIGLIWLFGGRRLRPVAVVFSLLWLSLVMSSIAESTSPKQGVVIGEDAGRLLAADSIGAPQVTEESVPAGVSVIIQRSQGDWTKVSLPDGREGWLPARAVGAVALDG